MKHSTEITQLIEAEREEDNQSFIFSPVSLKWLGADRRSSRDRQEGLTDKWLLETEPIEILENCHKGTGMFRLWLN